MARTVSPLSFVYKWKLGVGLTAALQEEIDVYGSDHDFLYLASRVPSVQLAASVPGELEAIIAARDEAVSAVINMERKKWQPIETAPAYDLVWLFEPHGMGGFQFAGMKRMDGSWLNNLDQHEQNPTYWMPLPEYPSPQAESEMVGVVAVAVAPNRQVTREESRSRGYTGNSCNVCGSMQMQIAGHCEVCAACGETTGCS